jgi:hypothetical protein
MREMWKQNSLFSYVNTEDSILNKREIIKKIAFLVKMAKMVSFRPNHKIFSGFVARSGKKKVHRNS